MARIPTNLHKYINSAFPENVVLVGTALPDGFVQISPRGSVIVYDDETINQVKLYIESTDSKIIIVLLAIFDGIISKLMVNILKFCETNIVIQCKISS